MKPSGYTEHLPSLSNGKLCKIPSESAKIISNCSGSIIPLFNPTHIPLIIVLKCVNIVISLLISHSRSPNLY
jgi:hypothetical protein